MLLYTENITARLKYIVDFFSDELFTDPLIITSDKSVFENTDGPRINYSLEDFLEGDFYIKQTPLLFEKGIQPLEIECFDFNYEKAFFQTDGDFPFDIFAATFYLLSRYEEYLPHSKDEYGRFAHTNSLAHKEHFLKTPLVNNWIIHFRKALLKKFPTIAFRYPSFTFIPTYDIDIAYKYKGKGIVRQMGKLFDNLVKGKWTEINEQLLVMINGKKDPYDVYEWLDSLHLYCQLKPHYFFLVAAKTGKYDRNLSSSGKTLRELVEYHAAGYRIGIHPSWQSGDDNKMLADEKKKLENLSGKQITESRQHYIRFNLPQTYRLLIQAGIKKDYSMGYGSINGFRASVSSSFYWYDLEKEEQTDLLICPFCYMDANSYYEQKLSPREAFDELLGYYNAIKKVNGTMISIWHNNFLTSEKSFVSWKEVYEVFLKDEVYWDRSGG